MGRVIDDQVDGQRPGQEGPRRSARTKTVLVAAAVVLVGVAAAALFAATQMSSTTHGAAPVASQAQLSQVQVGDNVSADYTLTFQNGTVLRDNPPINFTVGSGEAIRGFDQAVIGMRIGETKNVTLAPDAAYGEANASLIVSVPRSSFGNMSISVGSRLFANDGRVGTVRSINATNVTVDFNPPLAGQTLRFSITVVSIRR